MKGDTQKEITMEQMRHAVLNRRESYMMQMRKEKHRRVITDARERIRLAEHI